MARNHTPAPVEATEAKRTRTALVSLDLGTLNPVEVEDKPKTGSGRPTTAPDERAVSWVSDTYSSGKSMVVSLPGDDHVKALTAALRKAAASVDLGVAIRVFSEEDGSQTVSFWGKTKRQAKLSE